MMTRDREHHGHRRRSPESERRRRKERRDSREQTLNQLQHTPVPDPYQQVAVRQQQGEGRYYYESQPQAERPSYAAPSQPAQSQYSRSRALSSSGASSSSSTSSSLLNISRDGRRFGFMSFFTAGSEKHKRRVRKKRSRRMFRFGNGSSSSDLSDMAYGKGYIDRRRSRDLTPPGSHKRREGSDRDRPGPPKRGQTDEEIIELGRKFAEIARQQNKEDQRRAGRHKPAALLGAAAALTAFNKTSKEGHSARGIGSSKHSRHHSSDESDWESASEDESSSGDDGLVYGSATHLPHGGQQPIHISSPPPVNGPGEYEKLLQHKRSIVDPNLFGPVNSLRGHVNTPCGFDKVDRRTVSEGYQLPAAAVAGASIPQSETVSYEGRPMQHVYPVPTSDPTVFKTGRGSVISTDSHGRPAPVPIQHPKPIVPVSSKVFDATDADTKYSGRSSSSGTALAGAAAAGLAGAAIASALSDRKDKDDRKEDRRERELEREREREREEKRRSKRSEGKYTESIYSESRYGDERDEKRRSKRSGDKYAGSIISTSQYGDDRDEKRRSKRSDEKSTVEREEKRKSRDDNLDHDRSEARREKEGSKRDADEDREYEREKRRREKERADEYDHGREYRGNERREDRKKDKERRREERREERAIAGRASDVDVYRRIENPENPSTQGPIDPFQFQVGNSAFTTPQYSNTPVRPLTPSIFTVEREPDFSRLDDEIKNPERMSRRDSYERELKDTEAIYDSVKHSTAPIAAGAIGAATAAIGIEEVRGRGRSRSRGGDETSRVRDDNRDVVQDVANILYRRDLLARQAAEERSRSQSPDQSVVEKWKDGQAPAAPEIITPPAKDVPKPKSPYDAPDADVRIDNILSPRDLPIRTNGRLLKSRDPSAERDRPMLNLVRPTPVSTPQPEKQKAREETREEPPREEPPPVKESKKESKKKKKNPPLVEQIKSASDVGTTPRGEAVQPSSSTSTPSTPTSKAVTWGENQTRRYVVESPERGHGESSGTRIVEPAETPKSKSGKKSGWGILASAIAGTGAAAAASSVLSDSGKDKDREETSSNISSSSRRSRDRDSPKDLEKDRDETASNVSSSSKRSKGRDSPKTEDRDEVSSNISSRSRKSRDYEFPEVKDQNRDEISSNISSSSKKSRDRDTPKDIDEISSNISGSSRKSRDSPKGKRQFSVPWDEVEDPPIPGPKPSSPRGVPMPGSFAEDLAFTATVAAGLQDSGFDPNIVINDDKYHRRDSPPNTDGKPSLYQTPFAETVTDLSAYPVETTSSKAGSEHGLILGEVAETPRGDRDITDTVDLSKLSKKERKKLEKERAAKLDSFDNYDNLRSQIVVEEDTELSQPISEPVPEEDDWTSSTKLSKKEQKKRDKAARAQLLQEEESAQSTPRDSEPGTPQPTIEEDEWATSSKLSKKEKKKLEKAAKAKSLQEEEVIEVLAPEDPEPQPTEANTVDEWDDTPSKKKSKKDKKKDKAIIVQDDTRDFDDEDNSKISVPVDAFRDIQEEEQIAQPQDEWGVPAKKSKKKSKRDSAAFDLPSEPVSTSWADEVEESLPVLPEPQPEDDWSIPSKKSKKKSKRDSEIYDSPSQSIAPSEADIPRELHEGSPVIQQEDEWATPTTKKSKKKSKRDSGAYDLPSETTTPLDTEVSRAIEGEIQTGQPEDEWSIPSKKSKKKSKRDSVIYDSPSRSVAQDEVGESSKTTGEDEITVVPDDEWDAPKKSKKKHSKQDSFATDTTDWTNVPSVVSESMIKSQSTDYFSTAEPASVDDWEVPTKKSKKKSKRDSTSYDSPSQTPTGRDEIVESPKTTTESFTDLLSEKNGALPDEWDEPKKSKKKSKRSSQIYDSPSASRSASLSRTQSEISISDKRKSLPASEVGSESSEKKSKKEKRRSLPGGFPDDFDAYDQEDPPDRGRDKYPFLDNDVSSVVSAPLRDRSEKRRSRSRFDDRDDDTKSVASAPDGSRRKDSKSEKDKDKRSSAGPGLFDRFKSSIGIVDDKSSRKDDDKKALKDNAGTLGASVGLLGTAAALITAQLSPSNATDVPSEKEAHSVPITPSQRSPSPPRRRLSDSIDPEIVQREIRPAIDPQYGDLLPLPPSPPPGSPLTHETDELPALPDSRPETPEHERLFLRDLHKKPSHIRRKSTNESPNKTKSPSQSAIPLRFGIGKAKRTSEPLSPGFSRFSPMSSPIAAPVETLSATKARPARPTSWDSTREFKPLYLVEKTSRETVGSPVTETDNNLPQLPESGLSSRESPGPVLEQREHDDAHYEHARSLSNDLALKLDIPAALAEVDDTQLPSQDATPRAQISQTSDTFSTPQQAERNPEEPLESISKDPGSHLHTSSPSVKDLGSEDTSQDSQTASPSKPKGLSDIPESIDDTTSMKEVGLGLIIGAASGAGTTGIAMLDESSDRPVDNLPQEEEMPEFTFTSSKKSKKGKKGNKSMLAEVESSPGSTPSDETPQVPENSSMGKEVTEDEFLPISTSKKGKKGKKNKKAVDWEPEPEPLDDTNLTENMSSTLNTEDLPPVDRTLNFPESDQQKHELDFESPSLEGSLSPPKKSKKKKKGNSFNLDIEPENIATSTIELDSAPPTDTTLPPSIPEGLDTAAGENSKSLDDSSALQQPDIAEPQPTNVEEPVFVTKKGKKKKGKKSQSWEPEPEPEPASISSQDPDVATPMNTSSGADQQESSLGTDAAIIPATSEEPTSRLNTEIEESQPEYVADLSKDASTSPALVAQQLDTPQPISAKNELTTDTSSLESADVENTSLENSSAVRQPEDPAPISADLQHESYADTTESSNVKSVEGQLPINDIEASLQPNHTSGESQLQPDQDLSGPSQYPLPTLDSGDNTIDRLTQPPVDDNASSRDISNDDTVVTEQIIAEPSESWQPNPSSKKKKGKKDNNRQSASLESEPELPVAAIDPVEEPLSRDVDLSEQTVEVQPPNNDYSLATQPEMEATPDDIWATPVKSGKKGKKGKKNRQSAVIEDLGETPKQTIEEIPSTKELSQDAQLEPDFGNQPPVSNDLADEAEEDQTLVSTPQPEPEPEFTVSKKKSKKDKKKNRASSQVDNEVSETPGEQSQDPLPSQDTPVDVSSIPEPVPSLSEEHSLEQPQTEKETSEDFWPTPSKKSKKKNKDSSQKEEEASSTSDLPHESQDLSLPTDEVPQPTDDWDTGFTSSKKSKKDKKKRKVLFAGTSDENLLESRLNEVPADPIDNLEQVSQPPVEAGWDTPQDIAAIQPEVVAGTTSAGDLPLQFDGNISPETSQYVTSPNDNVDKNIEDMPLDQDISESVNPQPSGDMQPISAADTDVALNQSPVASEPVNQDSTLESLPNDFPATSAEEEFPSTKKSKKDKKKRKTKIDDMLESTSGTSTTEEAANVEVPALESAPSNISHDELREVDTQLMTTPEEAKPEDQNKDDLDEWASLPTKKSKKDKKKKKKGSQVQDVEPEHTPLQEPQIERSSSPGPAITSSDPMVADSPNISDDFKTPPEGLPSQPLSPTLGQDVAEPLISEQQNLNEEPEQLMTEDLSASQPQSPGPEAETLHPPTSEIHDVAGESQGQLSDEPPADNLQSPTTTPEVIETTGLESQPASEESSLPKEQPTDAGDDDFAPIASKKDKKKKKRRSLAQEPELTRKSSFEEMMDDWQTAEPQSAPGQEETSTPQLEQSTEAQGDEFAETSSKKSKKEKKKKRASRVPSGEYHPTTPSDDALLESRPASPLPDLSQTASSQLVSGDLGVDENQMSTVLERSNEELPASDQVSNDQLVSNPELMKDIQAITDQSISQNELPATIDTEEPLPSGPLPVLSADTDSDKQDSTEQQRSPPLEPQPSPDVQLDQEEPIEVFTTSKSKKDKKKKKRGSQILIEEPSIVQEEEAPAVTENPDQEPNAVQNDLAEPSSQPVEPLPMDIEVHTPTPQDDTQAADEFEPFTAKKSKKDKKKKKLASTWDDGFEQEQPQQLGDAENMGTEVTSETPQTEFSTPFTSLKDKDEDPFNFTPSKKSKKDKKKKGSSSWDVETPQEQEAPLEENRNTGDLDVEPSVEVAPVDNIEDDQFSGFTSSKKSKKDKKKKRVSSWEPEIEPQTETITHGEQIHDSPAESSLPHNSQLDTQTMPSLSDIPTLQRSQIDENKERHDVPVSAQDDMDASQPMQLDDIEVPQSLGDEQSFAKTNEPTGDQVDIEEPITSGSARATQESEQEQNLDEQPFPQHDPVTPSISEEPISQPSQEEEPEFFVTKKSKKDKKKKRASQVQDVEPESLPTPLADENPLETPFETPSETPFETPFENPLSNEPTAVETKATNETDMPASQDVQSEDVFPEFTSGKKSKKDKKKKKSGKLQDSELEPETSSSTPVEESTTQAEQLSTDTDIPSVEQPSLEPTSALNETRDESEIPASDEVQPEEAFPEFVTSKKSKKDKKKKRASQLQDWEPESSSTSPSQEETTTIPADVDQGSDEPVAQEDSSVSKGVETTEDAFPEFSTGKKSKKDKKKKKENQALDVEEPESLSTPLEQAQPFYTPLEEAQPILETSNEVQLSEKLAGVSTDPTIEALSPSKDTQPEDEFPEFSTGKKSKKDKKKKKGAQSQFTWEEPATPTPLEEPLSIQQPDNEMQVTEPLEDGNEASTEMPSTPKDLQPEDEFSGFVSTKKSKKDKKKAKKSETLLSEPELETELSTLRQAEVETSLQTSDDPSLTQTPVLEEQKQDATIISSDTTQVSKDLLSDPAESLAPVDTLTEPEAPLAEVEKTNITSTEGSNTISQDAHLEDTSNAAIAIPESQPESQPDDFPEFSVKKSKKDKKKGKKSKAVEPLPWEENEQMTSSQDISQDPISSQQPQEENSPPSEPVASAPISDERDDKVATLSATLDDTPGPVVEISENSSAQPTEPEISADKAVEEDMFPIIRKKSKKDKKKQKAVAQFDSEPTSGTQTPLVQDDQGQELTLPESLPAEPQDSSIPEVVEELPIQEPLEIDIGDTNVSGQPEASQPDINQPDASQPSVEDLPEFSTKKTKKDKKKRKSTAQLESDPPSGIQTPSADDTQLSRDIVDTVAPLETSETLITQEPISEEPIQASPVEEEWPQYSSKKSKKDKKKRKSTNLLESEPTSGTQTPLVETPTLDDSLNSSGPASEQTTQEVAKSSLVDVDRPASPVEDWTSFTTSKKSKKDKKGKKGKASGTATPLDVLQPTSEPSQQEARQEASLAEPEPSHAKDVWADEDFFKPQESSPGLDPYVDNRQMEVSDENRPDTPRGHSASTTAPTGDIDLSPAQLTSHVDHDKPFDQTTQRGKKVRTNTFLGDTEIPEPISAIDPVSSTPEIAADSAAIPDVTMEDSGSQSEKNPLPPTARDIAVDYLSSPHGKQIDTTLTSDNGLSTSLPDITPSREYAVSYLESQPPNLEDIISEAKQGKHLDTEEGGLPDITPRKEIAASYFDPQPEVLSDNHKGVVVAEYPPKIDEPSTRFEDEVPTPDTARGVAADLMDSRPGKSKRSSKSSPSNKDAEKNDDGPTDAEALAAAVALTGGVAMLADKFGGSKKTKGKKGKKSKYVDKRQPKEDDIFDDPSLWESKERKIVTEGDGGRLDADTGDFWDVPADAEDEQAEEPPAQITENIAGEEQQQPRGIAHDFISKSIESPESPIVGREETQYSMTESESPMDVQPEQLENQSVDASTSKLMRDIDDLDTSEPVTERNIEDDSPRHDIRQQMVSPSRDMDWARTSIMSARSLPPVEEEPHEEALGGDGHAVSRSRDAVRTPEVNRDSGFVTDSPRSARRSLFEDSGQRDSGVHMKDWPEHVPRKREGLSPSNETGARLSWESTGSVKAAARDVHTPKAEEKKARKSHLGNETPRLSTPTRTARETSPDPEKKDKSHGPETKTPRSGRYQQLSSAGSPALTPHAFGQRSISDHLSREGTPQLSARRSASNTSISRLRTPEPLNFRPESPGSSIRSGANTPPLRRVDKRMSGDLRSLSQHSGSIPSPHSPHSAKATDKDHGAAAVAAVAATALAAAGALHGKDKAADRRASQTFSTPVANEGRVRQRDMTDVYDGVGEGRIGSPRSPTRPHSMRRRQSMQVLELESKVEQLIAENRMLADAKSQADANLNQRTAVTINERDALIEQLRSSLEEYKREVDRLKEVNEGLQSANAQLATQHDQRYSHLELQHASASSELEGIRGNLNKTIQDKDAEIEQLRNELEATKQQVRAMQQQILASKPADADFLRLKDEDHFDHRCQQLCAHAQQWVLRFSKFSDMRASRLTSEINDVKIVDKLDNTVLDGSDVDDYLSDRVKRRDIFMSMTMHMIWEYVFTRYLFGMDREQRQKLKTLEKLLSDVGPPHAVRQWRAVTLTLLSRRPAFGDQRNDDTEAVVQAILETLSKILPPPSNMENQIQSQLRRVLREAVDLSIEMRTQRAEYMMLPPLQPEYDANGDLAETVAFNASLMNERSGSSTSNEDLEAQGAVVRMVLFPLVIKKGDDNGVGDEEIVVCPAQVLVAKQSHRSIRMVTPSSEFGGAPLSRGATPSAGMKSAISLPMSPGSQIDDHMEGAI